MLPSLFNTKATTNVRKNVRQARRKPTATKPALQWNPSYLPLVVATFGLSVILAMLPDDEFMPIEKIRLTGQFSQLDSNHIEQQLKPYLGISFFAVNIQGIQLGLQQRPWVDRASVRRIWPNELSVSILAMT